MNLLELDNSFGRTVPVEVGHQGQSSPLPTLILAPGSAYNMHGPLIEEIFKLAIEKNYLVFRFDWSYTKLNQSSSEQLMQEKADFESVIQFVLRHELTHPEKIYVLGKSLGSIVAFNRFQQHRELRAQVLLTPVCQSSDSYDDYYKNLNLLSRPTLVIAGQKDTLCSLPLLYEKLAGAQNVTCQVLPGDHGLELTNVLGEKDILKTQKNISYCANAIFHWLELSLS